MSTRIFLRLDFDNGRRLGPGMVALLEAIRRCGSISGAGREFGMAYRWAWLLTDQLNRTFAEPVVEARGGGRNGGGARLTEPGKGIATLYRETERKIHLSIASEIGSIEQALARSDAVPPERLKIG